VSVETIRLRINVLPFLPFRIVPSSGGSYEVRRQLCRLYLSMLDKMGVPQKTCGDATEPLAEF
jgi:hypothetical protein